MPIDLSDDFSDLPQTTHSRTHFRNPVLQNAQIYPLDQDLDSYAIQIKKMFHTLRWRDLPVILKMSTRYLEEFFGLGFSEQRAYAVCILNKVMMTDEPDFLPDPFPINLLQDILPPLSELIIFESDSYFLPETGKDYPSVEIITPCANEILDTYERLDWNHLMEVIRSGIRFANLSESVHLNEKKKIAKEFVDYVIEHKDKTALPKAFVRSIFKEISDESIDIIMNQLLILESR